MIKEVIILAGGLGTRLQEVVRDIPKAMAPVNGRPFLDYQFDYLEIFGVDHVVLSVGYLHEKIISHYGNRYKAIKIDYSIEKEPLGTGGGILAAMKKVNDPTVIAMNGDTFFMIDYRKYIDVHRSKGSVFSIILREVADVSRYGSIERDEVTKRITGFHEKSEKKETGYINGGIYIVNKAFFMGLNLPEKFSLEKDFLEKYYADHHFAGILCRQYFIDIGIPSDYARAQEDFKQFEYF